MQLYREPISEAFLHTVGSSLGDRGSLLLILHNLTNRNFFKDLSILAMDDTGEISS